MIKNAVIRVTFATACAIALAAPTVQAQTVDKQISGHAPRVNPRDRVDWAAAGNNMDNAQYERLLRTDPAFRQSRMMKECGSIAIAHLRAGCIDSFNLSEGQPSLGSNEGRTGGGIGTMNSTGAMPNGPGLYDNGAGR